MLVLLPVLLLGPALAGGGAWLHSHGAEGQHLHLLPAQLEPGHHASMTEWHHDQHWAAHEQDSHEQDESAPEGLLIDLPQLVAVHARGPRVDGGFVAPFATPQACPAWSLLVREGPQRPERIHAGRPPEPPLRSGIAALLLSSHAIRI